MPNIAGEYLSSLGLTQFRCAETEKYPHVTFFFNDYRDDPFDGEHREIIQSPKVATYDLQPEMSAEGICQAVLGRLAADDCEPVIIVNFANGDMVGHTGDLKATIDAMQVLDDCLEQLIQVIDEVGGIMIFTADHGNADIMYTEGKDGEITPKTSHTLSPVPFAIHDGTGTADYRLVDDLPDAGIANIAATAFNLMGLDAPDDYEPSLVEPA